MIADNIFLSADLAKSMAYGPHDFVQSLVDTFKAGRSSIYSCGFVEVLTPEKTSFTGDCESDMPTLVDTTMDIINDIKKGDMDKIYADGTKWASEVSALISECPDP